MFINEPLRENRGLIWGKVPWRKKTDKEIKVGKVAVLRDEVFVWFGLKQLLN